MGKAIYHGKVRLWWCNNCNVPLIGKHCSSCNGIGENVKITPPGEVKPCFSEELNYINSLFKEFGKKCEITNQLILLNRCPHTDKMDEIILNGKTIGNIRFEDGKNKLTLRWFGGKLIEKDLEHKWVIADDGAIKPILNGASLLKPGVIDCDKNIQINDDVVVLDTKKNVIANGIAKVDGVDFSGKGMFVKIRDTKRENFKTSEKKSDWEKIIKCNINHLNKLEDEAIIFIQNISEKYENIALSFSGGKDSLATLLLLIESGIEFKTFFLDTGLEFPETTDHVKDIANKYDLDLDIICAGDSFWEALNHFGPPSKDYRWCCKSVKLGPITRYIKQNYPKGVLTFIGQRKYESFKREEKGRIWKNDWVPNQIGASPIQNWTSLEVWMYIFWKNAPYNIWYEKGLSRIGCYMCPSTDLGDLKIVKENYEGYKRWEKYINNFAKENNLSDNWIKNGFWRWKKAPAWASEEFEMSENRYRLSLEIKNDKILSNKELDLKRLKNLLMILPEKKVEIIDNQIVLVKDKLLMNETQQLIIQSQECIGCSICTGRCPYFYLTIKNEKIFVEKECKHCMICIGTCPVAYY